MLQYVQQSIATAGRIFLLLESLFFLHYPEFLGVLWSPCTPQKGPANCYASHEPDHNDLPVQTLSISPKNLWGLLVGFCRADKTPLTFIDPQLWPW